MEAKALKEAETSEELVEMVQFVEQARTVNMVKLLARIKVCAWILQNGKLI